MAFPLALKALSKFSLRFQHRAASFVSLLVLIIPNRTAKLVDQNIRMCFPELSSQDQLKLYRNTVRHSCYSAFELAATWCWPIIKTLDLTVESDITDEFRESKKSRIVIVPHLGNWEILNLWLADQCDLMSLYKPQDKPAANQFILQSRSRNGATMLPVNTAGIKQLSRGLKQQKTVMILPDQRPKKAKTRILSKFFGYPAPTTALIQSLCKRIDCDVFIAAAFRKVDAGCFNICIKPLNQTTLSGEQQTSIDYMNSEIEALIRLHPEQYQWSYSRFKPSTYRAFN